MEVAHVLCFERNCSTEHSKEENPKRPNIYKKALITFVYYYFRSKIGWSTTLFLDNLAFFYYFRNPKIAYFYTFFTI
jgi:hypothetical protein